MSTSAQPRKTPYPLTKLDTTCAAFPPPIVQDEVIPSPSSTRSGTFARLRLGAPGMRRSKSTKSLGRTHSQGRMSIYSDATTAAEATPPLPTSASELTLAHSNASSGKLGKDESTLSTAKSFMHRSSRIFLKKKTSKSSLNSRTLDWIDETHVFQAGGDLLARRTAKHGRNESDNLKSRISQPFNFQHLTHTIADSNGSVPTHRAGQPSRELKGIKAYDLPVPKSAVEPTASASQRAEFQLRASRSVDSFKRISRTSFSTPYPPTITPPPRKSSRRPTPLIVPQESPTIPEFILSGRRTPNFKTISPKSPLSVSTGADDSPLSMMGIAQAVTTPDESACVIKGELTSPLEDVPEEDDMPQEPRSHPDAAAETPPDANNRVFRSGSDPVLPEGAQQSEEIPRASKRASTNIANGIFLNLDWDEDIDYCYDQLEADGVGVELDNNLGSPTSEVDVLYMKDGHRTDRISRSDAPLRLRRVSANIKDHTPSIGYSTGSQDSSPCLAVNEDYLIPGGSKGTLPLFTPEMSGDLHAAYSPRSSVSQLSKYPSGGSYRAASGSSSKRASGLATAENASTTSIPDLVPSRRKSSSTKRSSAHSQACAAQPEGPVATQMSLSAAPMTPSTEMAHSGTLAVSRIPLRKRSFSDSASKVLTSAGPRPMSQAHTRAKSYAMASTSPRSPRTPYSLFPPLDRIGATAPGATPPRA